MSAMAEVQTALGIRSPLAQARLELAEPVRPDASLTLLGAAALLAISALLLAGSVILGPFWQIKDAPAAAAPLR